MTRLALCCTFVLACTGARDAEPGHEGHSAPSGAMPDMPAVQNTPAATDAGHGDHAPPEASPPAPEIPSGLAEVTLSEGRQQLIGVKTGRAEVGALGATVRAQATVQVDERREEHVHSKLTGWVQELFVSAVGERVEKGQALYSLYSQELFTAEQEFSRARRTAPGLAAAARERLRLWDVPEDQIKRIEQKGPQRTLIFRSPIAGTVVEKEIVKGHYLEPDMMLYRIADLSEVWIIANVYENEVNRLDRGLLATVRVQGVPGSFKARIDFLHPTLDETTRTLRVRLVAPNPAGLFRPGSFATVELPVRGTEVVWVPDEAVIDTGTRQLVYLALPGGRFRPRQVLVGRRGGGRTEIVRGLQGGEQVVVSAQFLLDSESRLRGAGSEGAGGHQGHQ